jgi:hypothetical protein
MQAIQNAENYFAPASGHVPKARYSLFDSVCIDVHQPHISIYVIASTGVYYYETTSKGTNSRSAFDPIRIDPVRSFLLNIRRQLPYTLTYY